MPVSPSSKLSTDISTPVRDAWQVRDLTMHSYGYSVGATVGGKVGVGVGAAVGAFVGALVGVLVGAFVGTLLGALVEADQQAAPESFFTSVNATTLLPLSSHVTVIVLATVSMLATTAP